MSEKLRGKVAVVTGSGRGIGRAMALKLASEGARLVLNDLDDAPAAAVREEIIALGGEAVACCGNVAAADFADRLIAAATGAFGGLDILINNAGYTWDNVIQKTTDEQWHAMLDVHLTAPFRILRAAQPVIRELSRTDAAAGRRTVRKVVNISSVAGVFGNAGQANYSAAKAGIMGLTMTLAKEWGRLNTTVNCVAYGLIRTRMTEVTGSADAAIQVEGREIKVGVNPGLMAMLERSIPLGRAGTPEEAAGAAYLFCIPESDYVSGQTVLCTGGLTGI
ncbi:SDR family oxidoreductase [Alicycliphilus denitrificans]|uniref:SDR family oxidoreductase n=1 Tax=Alicycliphilus denitrificans TaxID=179636 RepID=A0A858ZSB9_9BURK|nr:SDR family NAD(P)-dependent oxidoreductase [Alicycliphilus denitrificans]ADU99565.1 short-chain dehydrogenase/reductase SDR [Alicycliphilus denitrificans BC]QKD43765.1 SDR family oxidoreductase [Alicycliphilus denitrificans]GAO21898.1 3-oxoacyl-(acyl-carrier-protein) reductase [Alicycliphilus sp. B1]GAO22837.1 3-oxoacyl-(acyl-carrier-protein) reductase [Alicycliphilus sp. B1]